MIPYEVHGLVLKVVLFTVTIIPLAKSQTQSHIQLQMRLGKMWIISIQKEYATSLINSILVSAIGR